MTQKTSKGRGGGGSRNQTRLEGTWELNLKSRSCLAPRYSDWFHVFPEFHQFEAQVPVHPSSFQRLAYSLSHMDSQSGYKSSIDDDCEHEQEMAYTELEPWLKTDSMSGYYPNVVYQEPRLSQMV
nr:hypothetical protein [Tanacetum cinerariifolium]